eukprot:TRINITY_DN9025_c0_g2_i1.p1 TRINITY_DN9025_c0_g2~~TRINITY_DN9025_c0_g2_i1.p1  ORF type:complete len:1174 (-),score=150.62 TRINITY_DN9025_c0_g2_i1:313-3690(-)
MEESGDSGIPNLGRFGDRYQVLDYVTRGGQAIIWTGLDRTLGKQVILRFPMAMCSQPVCLIEELHPDTIAELLEGCTLASTASNHFQQFISSAGVNREFKRLGVIHDPFATCLRAISTENSDPAFEVWSMAGNSTLAEEFFLGDVSLDTKRHALAQLKFIIASLGHPSSVMPCCCRRVSPMSCTTNPQLSRFDRMMGNTCPKYYSLKPGHCGPMVHHDINFANVMLQRSSSGEVSPVVIDFGAATLCSEGQAHGYSQDWVPYWIPSSQYRLSVSNAECFGYDLYAVGLAWLIVELLRNLDGMSLICRAADMLGLTSVSTSSGNLPDLRMMQLTGTEALQRTASSAHTSCGSDNTFRIDKNLKSTALRPVFHLVHELHTDVLNMTNLESEDLFIASLQRFLAKRETEVAEGKPNLHLAKPSDDILAQVIFPLLRECPSAFAEESNQVLKCRFDAASRRLKEAVKNKHFSIIPGRLLQYREACSKMSKWCSDGESAAMMVLITHNDSEAIGHLFEPLEKDGQIRLANMVLADGESLLAMAAQSRLAAVVDILLRNGADPFLTSLSDASNESSIRFISFSGSDMPLPALLAAAKQPDNIDVLRMLLDDVIEKMGNKAKDALASLHATKIGGFPAGPSLLSITAESGDLEMLTLVLDIIRPSKLYQRALNPAINSPGSHSPLLRAASAGRAGVCQSLIDAGADVKVQDTQGWNALLMAVSSTNLPTVQAIGAASRMAGVLDATTPNIGTPLHMAATGSDPEIVEALLSLNANPAAKNSKGDAPLHVAIGKESPSLQIVKMLAQSNEAQAAQNSQYETPLVAAARQCLSVDALITLVHAASPAVLHKVSRNGYTALHWAAAAGQLDCLEALIQHSGIDSFGTGPWGETALMAAVRRGQIPALQVLMEHGTEDYAFQKDARGRPLSVLAGWRNTPMRFGRTQTLLTLVDMAGTKILEEQDPFGMSVIGRWSYDGDARKVGLLLELGADCNATFKQTVHVNREVEESLFGGLGVVNGWTPLKLVRKRIHWVLQASKTKTLPQCRGESRSLNWWSYMGAWCAGKPSWRRLFVKLYRTQLYLEQARCDAQDSRHISGSQPASGFHIPWIKRRHGIIKQIAIESATELKYRRGRK